MNNKKGFTLIELLAVIVILIIVTLIAVPVVLKLVKSSKEKAYQAKVDLVVAQAKQYAKDHEEFLYDSNKFYTDYVCNTITVNQLFNAGYLQELKASDGSIQNITNPIDGSSLSSLGINVYIDAKKPHGNDIYNGPIVTNFKPNECVDSSNIMIFAFTKKTEEYTAENAGYYKLEVWGAEGGSASYDNRNFVGGKGSYSVGSVYLKQGEKLYITVGEKGTSITANGNNATPDSKTGFNGGTAASYSRYRGAQAGGGGATHIALRSGLLKELSNNVEDVLIVAGGGGGASANASTYEYSHNGGYGGGAVGGAGIIAMNYMTVGRGGSQTTGGYMDHMDNWQHRATHYSNTTSPLPSQEAVFGQGAGYLTNNIKMENSAPYNEYAGGGGGFFGGGPGWWGSGGGGSGYIGNARLFNKKMYCQNCVTSKLESDYTQITDCVHDYNQTGCIMNGDGYARISYTGAGEDPEIPYVKEFIYTGDEQEYTVPETGKYLLETWGAEGGYSFELTLYRGGYGGYASGIVELNQNDKLYINVGGQGRDYLPGYNGGGSGRYECHTDYYSGGGGGGATSVALSSGELKDLSEAQEDILIVAGGGGGSAYFSGTKYQGGDAGGYIANNGAARNANVTIAGATQETGYQFGQGEDAPACGGSFGYSGRGGGGGGFYGGRASQTSSDTDVAGGSGGSSYVNTALLTSGHMYCYNCQASNEHKTSSTTCAEDSPTKNCAKKYAGYARLTYLGE